MTSKSLRRLNYLLLALLHMGSAAAFPNLPGRIPLHADFSGRVTAWAPTTGAMWFLLPAIATAFIFFAYAASAASGPEGWQLAASDVRRFRELDPERRARISEWVARATALVLILATVSLMGVQLASYLTAVGGASRAPWYAEVLVIIPLAVVLILSLRGGRALRARLRGN